MDFLKPTKSKFLATLIIYISYLLSSWIGTSLALLLIPQSLLPETMQVVSELKENIDIPLTTAFGLPVATFLIRILLFYLAASYILAISKRKKQE